MMKTKGGGVLALAGLLFVGFLINLVVGKIAIMNGATQAPGLGDVGEFLLLFVAVLLFIVGCLQRETARDRAQQADKTNPEEE